MVVVLGIDGVCISLAQKIQVSLSHAHDYALTAAIIENPGGAQ